MADYIVKEQELAAADYLDGIYFLDWSAMCGVKRATAADPTETRKRGSDDQQQCGHSVQLLFEPTWPQQEDLRGGAAHKSHNHHASE